MAMVIRQRDPDVDSVTETRMDDPFLESGHLFGRCRMVLDCSFIGAFVLL